MFHKVLPAELEGKRAANPNLILLDVREDHELEISVLPGIVHIPMSEMADRWDELDQEDEVIVICRTGGRSARVAEFLVNQGFANVSNLETGMNGYAETVDPSLTIY